MLVTTRQNELFVRLPVTASILNALVTEDRAGSGRGALLGLLALL